MNQAQRTEMKCVRCGGFSSTRTCWHCSNVPDAIEFAELELLRKNFKEALDLLELCTSCDLIYGLAFAKGCGDYDDPRTVADEVRDFLKFHGR